MGTRMLLDRWGLTRGGRTIARGMGGVCAISLWLGAAAQAQNVQYDTEREVSVPDYATVRIGSLYSTMVFHSSVGYRYTRSSGAGTDYIYGNDRGRIKKDGSDFPMIVGLDTRNFIALTRHSSVDLSVRIAYRYFPLDTEESEWTITVPDERIDANFSTTYRLSPRLNGIVYDRMEYVTDYVDLRGRTDDYGGQKYTYFQNRVGSSLTSTLTEKSWLTLDLSRLDHWVLDNEDTFGDQERYEYRESLIYTRRFYESIIAGLRADFTQQYYKEETRPDTTLQNYSAFIGGDKGGGIPLTDATTLSLRIGTAVAAADSTSTQESQDQTELTGGATLRTQLTKNLSHALTYDRGLRSGFDTAFEEYSTWGYSIDYDKVGNRIRFYSYYDTVSPTATDLSSYNVWVNGVAINYPLLTYLTLDTSYEYVRTDNSGPDSDDPDFANDNPELVDDYYARVARIGSSLRLMKKLSFRAYVERYERLSDVDTLEFTRDTFEATLAYSHQL